MALVPLVSRGVRRASLPAAHGSWSTVPPLVPSTCTRSQRIPCNGVLHRAAPAHAPCTAVGAARAVATVAPRPAAAPSSSAAPGDDNSGVAAPYTAAGDVRADYLAKWHARHGRYPQWRPTLTLSEFAAKYRHLEPGSRDPDTVEVVAGRVVAKRQGSKATAFLDVEEGYVCPLAGSDASCTDAEAAERGLGPPTASSGANDGPCVRLQVLAIRGRYEGAPHVVDASSDGAGSPEGEAYGSKEEFQDITGLVRRGDVIGVRGYPGKSKAGELSIIPTRIVLLAPCLPNLPLPSRNDSDLALRDTELRYRQRHVDLLVNKETRRTFVARSRTMSALRRFLEARGFLEVETPLLSPSAGGALARPFLTRSWAWDTELALRIAPELFLKRLVIGGLDRVFEIGKVFRNEGVTPKHNPEFTSCEFYQAYADLDSLIETTEQLLLSIVTDVTGATSVNVDMGGDEATAIDFTPPFRRVWIVPALEEKLGCKLPDVNDPACTEELARIVDGRGLLEGLPQPHTPMRLMDRLISELLEPECVQPTFLCGHPVAMSPLAKAMPDQPGLSSRFELFVAGMELANAYAELNDPDEQRRRFGSQMAEAAAGDAEAHCPDEDYCQALEVGLPPTGGWGMGVDRLVGLLTGAKHIREVLLFPMMKPVQPSGSTTPASAAAAEEGAGEASAKA